MIADLKMHTEAKARPNAAMWEAMSGEKIELDTQYEDCKTGRCKLPGLRGVLEDRQGTQVRFLMLTMLPLLPADYTSERTRICHTK